MVDSAYFQTICLHFSMRGYQVSRTYCQVSFYQFYAEISTFSIKKCLVRLLSMMPRRHARGRLTPPGIRWKYAELVKIAKNLVGYARKEFLVYPTGISVNLTGARKCHFT